MKIAIMPARWIGLVMILMGMVGPVKAQMIFVANNGNDTVSQIDPSGNATMLATGISFPNGVALDASGHVYVAAAGTTSIEEYAASGVHLGTFATTGLDNPMGLAFDANGNLYAANFGSNTLEKYSPAGIDLGVFASTGLSGPTGLRFDSNGNLYVANYFTGDILEFSPGGSSLTFSANVYTPGDLAFDANGNIYVSDQGNKMIEKLSATGVDLGEFASTGDHTAIGLAFDAGGNLYAAYRDANIIEEFAPNGADLGGFATSGLDTPTFLAIATVPEPATWALLAGAGGLAAAFICRSPPTTRQSGANACGWASCDHPAGQ